ncbi:MAG: glycosyltransferase family 4 protein [Chloroflexi bacterium]|nr:glycosyltransferase family 4 protein [Chloroflexota bacterium]
MPSKRTVLYVSHGHPAIRPGGAEVAALELYEAMRASPAYESILLARTGPPASQPHLGTPFSMVGRDPNQYFLHTDAAHYDWFLGTQHPKSAYLLQAYQAFLAAHRPDVVHFQHTALLGYELIRATRNVLPDAPLVYTLHEFLPLCFRDGQMLRTFNQELCREESPRRCHECFPTRSPQEFYLRKRYIQSHLSLIDLFLAPSRFLIDRFVEWGIPPDRIRFQENGRHPRPVSPECATPRPRARLGFFGQITPYKGVDVLLTAMETLGADRGARRRWAPDTAAPADAARPHLWLYGANLDGQPPDFRDEIRRLLGATRRSVTFAGAYRADDLGALMAEIDWVVVPSIWWENAPMVIQEAFLHGRPVICANIGGMAEKVTDGVNGLHFRVGDPFSLARTIERAATTPGLWDDLRAGIPTVYSASEAAADLTAVYDALLDQATARLAVAPGSA